MTKKILAILGALAIFSALQQAEARGAGGVMLTANAFMYNEKVDNNGATSEANTSIYDFKLGYLLSSGVYLGGIYALKMTDDGTTKKDGSATGASLGYVGDSGFFIQGHYFLSAKFDKLTEGTGYQGDLGYVTSVSSAILLGVELSYRNIEYKKNNDVDASVKVTELLPKLTLGFAF